MNAGVYDGAFNFPLISLICAVNLHAPIRDRERESITVGGVKILDRLIWRLHVLQLALPFNKIKFCMVKKHDALSP
jgi:hypothetical protein